MVLLEQKINKKGSITDIPFLIGGIFAVALVALLVSLVVIEFDDKVQDNTIFNTKAKTASTKMSDDLPNVMDGGIVFLFFSLSLISLVLASLVPIHPVFLIFYIFEWVILIWFGAGISNTYQKIIELNLMAEVASKYTFTTHFFHYFPYIIGIFGAILAIVMYKVRGTFWGGQSAYG